MSRDPDYVPSFARDASAPRSAPERPRVGARGRAWPAHSGGFVASTLRVKSFVAARAGGALDPDYLAARQSALQQRRDLQASDFTRKVAAHACVCKAALSARAVPGAPRRAFRRAGAAPSEPLCARAAPRGAPAGLRGDHAARV